LLQKIGVSQPFSGKCGIVYFEHTYVANNIGAIGPISRVLAHIGQHSRYCANIGEMLRISVNVRDIVPLLVQYLQQ